MIEIKNLRKEKPINQWDIRVDRQSILGNPFYMSSESQRNDVCDKYEQYFYSQIENNEAFKQEVIRLCELYKKYGKFNLFCWCAPKRCHAETIKDYIECFLQRERE